MEIPCTHCLMSAVCCVQVVNKCYLIVPSKEHPSRIECPTSPPPPTTPFSLCGLFVSPLLCSSQRVKEGKVMSGPPGFHCVLALCHCIACRPQTHVQGTFLFSPAQQLASNSTLTSFKSMQMLTKQQRNFMQNASWLWEALNKSFRNSFCILFVLVVPAESTFR